ncbi:BA75_04676T0 [Komagataella pastoris]|uniref:BA75_04676T0 n=1 Tax=Komagataella pastoris TaxID=4922 RepID=A0A1B2JIK3_PICPA|nr:BA75_04676T0 [Komagataella pastoris]
MYTHELPCKEGAFPKLIDLPTRKNLKGKNFSAVIYVHYQSSEKMSEIPKLTHPRIKDGWFREISDDYFPGQAMMLRVEEILLAEKSEFQDILVFKSTDYGNVLVLDGIIQVTERDEFAYQEMITHLPMFSHPNPKRILVIGGGDGGVLREVVKHPSVESATLVEIDSTIIDLSRKYLPSMSSALDHPKVKICIQDGFKFLEEASEKFDVIITDSSDPEGPAEAFFQENYFHLLKSALTPDGIVISQASENIWLKIANLKKLKDICQKVFTQVKYSYCTIPTYTSGQLGLMVCTDSSEIELTTPSRRVSRKEESELFRYYNAEIHTQSFVLPTWAEKVING